MCKFSNLGSPSPGCLWRAKMADSAKHSSAGDAMMASIMEGYWCTLCFLFIPVMIACAGVEGSVIVGKLLEGQGGNYGYNAATNEYGDLVKQGIIDPLKVSVSSQV